MDIHAIMTRTLLTIAPEARLLDAIDLMLGHGLSALPVVDAQEKPIGVISETDLLFRSELETGAVEKGFWARFDRQKNVETYVRLYGRTVRDVMTPALCSVPQEADVVAVVRQMREQGVRRVYVTHEEKLVGVVSGRDIMKALRTLLSEVQEPLSDEEIRERLERMIATTSWAPEVHPEVKDGCVTWNGVARDEKDIAVLRVLAENTPGVTCVQDRTFLLSPGTGYSRLDSGSD